VLAFDHVRKEIWLVVTADVTRGKPADAYDNAVKRLNKLEKRLARRCLRSPTASPGQAVVKHRTSKKNFLAALARTKEYISAGDVFQTVLSQRFDVEPGADSFQVYRACAPSTQPYMFFLRFAPTGAGQFVKNSSKKGKAPRRLELAGSSPELLVRVHAGKVEYRPSPHASRGVTERKTRPRRRDVERRKERAEHVMLVDLAATT